MAQPFRLYTIPGVPGQLKRGAFKVFPWTWFGTGGDCSMQKKRG